MEKPGIFVYAVPGQRKALIEVAQELDRRGFPFLYASHGSAPAIEPEASSEGVVRPYEGTAVWQDALTHALALGMATERIQARHGDRGHLSPHAARDGRHRQLHQRGLRRPLHPRHRPRP